MDAILIHRS